MHRLDHASLLVGGDEKADICCGFAGYLGLDHRRYGSDAVDARVAPLDEPDGPDMVRLNQVDFGGTKPVAGQAELEQLTDPLIRRHDRQDPFGAG